MTRKRTTLDDIDLFFEYGLDVPNRTIYLGEADYDMDSGGGTGVDFRMTERFIKALHILDKSAPAGDKPILVITNNPGGSWYDGMAIYGAIKAAKNFVTIKMYGYAMSMGSVIPQAADERIIDTYCRFMIHYGYDGSSTHSKIFSKHGDEGKKVNHMMENIYLDRMMEKDEFETNAGSERYLEGVLADIVNRQQELDYPTPTKVKFRFSTNEAKRREDVRAVLKGLLDYDTFLSADETVAIGFACKREGKE